MHGDLGQFANIFWWMRENKWDTWLEKYQEHRNIYYCQEPNRKHNLIKHKTVKSKNRAINFSGSLLIQFGSLRGFWPGSVCQHKSRVSGMWTLRNNNSPCPDLHLSVCGTCRGKGCLWNRWSQELSDEIIAVWEIEAAEGWGPDWKTRLEFLPHYDPGLGPEEEEMMLTEQLNWNPTLLGTAGQSEASLGSVDQWEVTVVWGWRLNWNMMMIRNKGSGDDQRLNNRHTRNIVISDVFIPPKIHTVIKCVNLFRSLDYI